MSFFLFNKKTNLLYFGGKTLQANVANGVYFEGDVEKIFEGVKQDKTFVYFEFNQKVQHKIQTVFLVILGFLFFCCQIKFWSPLVKGLNFGGNENQAKIHGHGKTVLVQKNPYSEPRILEILSAVYESKLSRVAKFELGSQEPEAFPSGHVRFPLMSVRGIDDFVFITSAALRKKFSGEKVYALSKYSKTISIQNAASLHILFPVGFCENNKSIYIFELLLENTHTFLIKTESSVNNLEQFSPQIKNSIVLSAVNSKSLKNACEKFELPNGI